jgi:hypothetical protein
MYARNDPLNWLDSNGRDPERVLTFTTNNGGPNMAAWQGQWRVDPPSEQGGIIVQEIISEATASTFDGSQSVTQSEHFFEAWEVAPGQSVTTLNQAGAPNDDTFAVRGVSDEAGRPVDAGGRVETTATARFYEGQALPDSFVPNNPNTGAGNLPSTTTDPNLPTENATPPVERKWETNF